MAGTGYKLDNTKVHQILTELTIGTDAAQWIKDFARNQDGRGAWQNLCSHYYGNTEGDKRVMVARHDIKIMCYKNEPSFSFEKYSTRLKKAFFILDTYKQPKSKREKLDILLGQINTSNVPLTTAIRICRDRHNHTFDAACSYLSQKIAILFQQHSPEALGYQGQDRNKFIRFRGVSSVTRQGNKTFCLGDDMTDTKKYFSQKEFDKMGPAGRENLNKFPKRKAARDSHRKKNVKRRDKLVETRASTI